MNPNWKQDRPIDQYGAILFALEGSLDNAKEGINPEKSLEDSIRFAEELRELYPYLKADPEIWPNTVSPTTEIYFFGVSDPHGAGHHMMRPSGGDADDLTYTNPWKLEVDGGLCPKRDNTQGLALLHHKDGWTALSFWDQTGDSRPGSNSNFLARGTFTFDQMIELAKMRFPRIMTRFTFSIKKAPKSP